MTITLNKKEKLLHALLFSKTVLFEINIEEYCNINDRSEFREEIRNAVKRGGLQIIEDRIIHKEDKVIWKIEIKR